MHKDKEKEFELMISFLEESEEKFKRIFIDSPIGILILDRSGEIIDINDSGCDIFEVNQDIIQKEAINIFKYFNISENEKKHINKSNKIIKETALTEHILEEKEQNRKRYINYIITAIYTKDNKHIRGSFQQGLMVEEAILRKS